MGDSPDDVEELEGEVLEGDGDERSRGEDAGISGYLSSGVEYLDALISQGGKTGLGGLRRAVKKTSDLVRQAEQAGYARARRELAGQQLGPEGLERLRLELREELTAESSRERSLARLGIGPESPVRQLFENVHGDHAAYERQASLLRAAGVTWDADPLVRQIGQQQVAAWQEQVNQAMNGNGPPLDLSPSGPVPEQVRDDYIRSQVEQMARAQAGSTPIGADGLEERIAKAAQDPGQLDNDARYALAAELNNELDALSRARQGVW